METLIDTQRVFADLVSREADRAEADAVIAEITLRQWQILSPGYPADTDLGDRVAAELQRATVVAGLRRTRADGVRAQAGLADPVDARDMRPDVALRLQNFQANQVLLDEMDAHPELYAADPDDFGVEHHPAVIARPPAAQIAFDAAKGRAMITAHSEWLDAHPSGPDLTAEPDDSSRATAYGAARRYYRLTTDPAASPATGPADVALAPDDRDQVTQAAAEAAAKPTLTPAPTPATPASS